MLDFNKITIQIHSFTAEHARGLPHFQAARAEAGRRLRASGPTWEETQARIDSSRTSWLVADLMESPDRTYTPPPRPLPCAVLATDGSQIVADRHDIALCYLINIGLIALRYGTGERAYLHSRPTLAQPDEDLLDEFQGEQTAIAPRRLTMRRLLAELAGLAEMIAANAPPEISPAGNGSTPPSASAPPTLALLDGTLILWPLEAESETFRAEALSAFQTQLEIARQHRVPLAGYISKPASRDVVNALRIFHCPHPRADCDRYCPNRSKPRPDFVAPDCAGTERITDAELFEPLLAPGERSAVFGSRSKILNLYDEVHRIRFFYLNIGREVARVEIPDWVAADPELLAWTQSLCYDQAQKGDGYPVALAEAHELAIVRGVERDAFFRLVEREFVRTGLPVTATRKSISKRARRV
ncbi:MAG TPA: DNA double-strand break repair nuclease NurA [Chthonomonadaceae bacterium]|nr:DNA double-strand break repair nuclease NurA [Chthonomonadaceae bacterium]